MSDMKKWLMLACEANPDGMFPADLEAFDRELQKAQEELEQMRQYVQEKLPAMKARAAGEINEALRLEHNCQLILEELPDWLRW